MVVRMSMPGSVEQASPKDVNPSQSERIDPYQGRSDFEGRHILNLGGSIAVPRMAGFGVRREKAALSGGCKPHPAIRSSRKQSEQSWR